MMAFTFTACTDDDEDAPDTGTVQDADIVAYTFAGIDGKATIDKTGHTVTAVADDATELNAIVAEFTLSKDATAKVGGTTQVSKQTANNFTSPVTYAVTSGDGETTQNWTVTVTGGKTNGGDGTCQTELTREMVENGGTFPKCTYIIKGGVTVNSGKTLTFAPGTVIKFDVNQYGNKGYIMGLAATIVAKGTEQEPIVFTSAKANKAAGDWNYILCANFDFEWCTFEYGGGGDNTMLTFSQEGSFKHCTLRESINTGLRGNGTFTAFEHNTITNCGETVEDEYPMSVPGNSEKSSVEQLEAIGAGNIINTTKGVWMGNGAYIIKTATLHKLNCPYLFKEMSVGGDNSNSTLTIEPGVQIKIGNGTGSNYLRVHNNAVLIAKGTETDPIIITGYVTGAGTWNGIYFEPSRGAGCILEYCRIIGGGYDVPIQSGDAGVVISGYPKDGSPVVTVRNCYIADSPTWGIYWEDKTTCSQSGNTFVNCIAGNYPTTW
jgi:hypothetical protein